MLEFLVTSKARRRMLTVLWSQGAAGSASQLARLANVGFASAYRELRAMHALGLVATTRRGVEVYRANFAHPAAGALRALIAAPSRVENPGDVRVRSELKGLGAPLQASEATEVRDVEAALVRGVALAHRDPDVARTLPVCLFRQRDRIRVDALKLHATQLGEKRALGFFLALTSELSGDDRFATWAGELRDRRCTAQRDFFHPTSRSRLQRRLAERKTPPLARRWGLRMNMDVDAFRSTFDRFAHAA